MSISERFRELVEEIGAFHGGLLERPAGSFDKGVKLFGQAFAGLTELQEGVGEIPRIRLESKLSPVLLKAHTQLDRARLLLEEAGEEDLAAGVWELEQKVYRLLNAL